MLESKFGKYRIEGIAGAGGMSVVYRAFDESLERVIALKVLNIQRAADSVSVRRFEREVQIAQRLTHPNIITIYEAGEVGDRAYLAMEYMPEGSLARRFAKPVPMTLGESAALLIEIASALDFAHANGVVHRDLKLENVLINDEGHLALSDFGIAQILDVTSLTETGQTFGTPLYVSPEQVRGAKNVDYRTDLYSLGIIAYLLATGYFPFAGNSGLAILHSHLTQEPPLPSNLNPRLPPQMDWVLLKGLSKNPQDRFASAGAQAEAFASAITRAPGVEIVILASQPTPIVAQTGVPISRRTGEPGVGDTVPIGEFSENPLPRRRGGAIIVRIAAVLVILALVSILLLGAGRILTPPPEGIATQSASANAVLAETEATSTSTSSPTQTMTSSPTRTETPSATASLTRTPSATASPTWTATSSPTATRTPPPSKTPRPSLTPTTPVPTGSTTTTAQMLLLASGTPSPTRVTSVPATHVPPTMPAPTSIPPTSVPPTQAPPPTSVPPTSVPPTSVPPTPVPPTPVPPTPVPPTQAPPPTATGILDPLIPPIVPTLLGGLLG